MKKNKQKGFSAIEIIIVIALMVILIGAVLLIVNPGEQLAKARNNQRKIHLETIYSVVEQYSFQHKEYPQCIAQAGEELDVYSCQDLIPEYLNAIPLDPICGSQEESGYIIKRSNGKIGVTAPCAEGGEVLMSGSYQFEIEEEEEEIFACGDEVNYQGASYPTMEIGEQCWMTKNLNYQTEDSWCYDDQESYCDEYGRLYAVTTLNSVCPSGWKVPTDSEVKELEVEMGMSVEDSNGINFRGSNEGSKLSGGEQWGEGDLKEDGEFGSSGFNLLPGGRRSTEEGESAYWWTSTESEGEFWARFISKDETGVGRDLFNEEMAFSVRCLKN